MKLPLVILYLLATLIGDSNAFSDEDSPRPIMVSATNGWRQTYTDKAVAILLTDDGGKTWQDRSPARLPQIVKSMGDNLEPDELVSLCPLDARRAWASITTSGSNEQGIFLEYTDDSGQHWVEKHASIKADSAAISFLNEKRGFLLALGGPAGGGMAKYVYGTDNGGDQWQMLASPPTSGSYYPTGITFRNTLDGWVTATYHGGPDVPLYRTVDGGKTWQPQTLDVPDDYKGGYGNTYPPVFIGAEKKQGYLPVNLVRHTPAPDHSAWVNYVTDDGGATWHLPASGVQSFLDK